MRISLAPCSSTTARVTMATDGAELQHLNGGAQSSSSPTDIIHSNPNITLKDLNLALKNILETQDPNEDWSSITQYHAQQTALMKARPNDRFEAPSKQPHGFFDLPVEIRHSVYELIYTPSMVHAHILRNKRPAPFYVNREMHLDFANFYYSRKIFKMRVLHPDTGLWEEMMDPVWVRAVFEEWRGCLLYTSIQLASISTATVTGINETYTVIDRNSRSGVLHWLGQSTRSALVRIALEAMPIPGRSRVSRLESNQANEEENERMRATAQRAVSQD